MRPPARMKSRRDPKNEKVGLSVGDGVTCTYLQQIPTNNPGKHGRHGRMNESRNNFNAPG